jgi:N-acyl-D-amino-acid deacylase
VGGPVATGDHDGDGLGYAPAGAATVEYVRRYFGAVDGPQPTVLAHGGTVADLLAGCDRAVPVNVAYRFLPRPYGMPSSGCQPLADDGALATMADMVRQGMNEGAVGLSSGREYMPGAHADAAEWAELTRVVAAYDGVYVTHMRGYDNAAGQGVQGTIHRRRQPCRGAHFASPRARPSTGRFGQPGTRRRHNLTFDS